MRWARDHDVNSKSFAMLYADCAILVLESATTPLRRGSTPSVQSDSTLESDTRPVNVDHQGDGVDRTVCTTYICIIFTYMCACARVNVNVDIEGVCDCVILGVVNDHEAPEYSENIE